ncbi:beta-glucoside operon transcriptional antiterminator [Pantoea agglomerans]|uniref:PRD domain-containing protein n=1 Tax=Enterobacter agglomerans TaxID=549 RepID=UPI0015FA94B0|nr:PRD domain-containing protein [Pantoea agglomerans]MBA8867101.1 beta-glucoside operon transcriptional antiterminator [Pantoea agglomerans]MBA8894141.1 beta-glucoside operon transcriptional antiterminator [Pantoea agglomerans]
MKILKILSNNAIVVENNQNETLVALGKGIGFGHKPGDSIDPSLFEAQYLEKSENTDKPLEHVFDHIPEDIIRLSCKIAGTLEQSFSVSLQQNFLVALSDHIYYAISRASNNLPIKNPLSWDIRIFYPEEYRLAREAVQLINREMSVSLDEDEAGFIALHIITWRNNGNMYDTVHSTNLIKDIIKIIKLSLISRVNEDDVNFRRLIVHLKFFSYRMIKGEPFSLGDNSVYIDVAGKLSESYQCTEKIALWIYKQHRYEMNYDEKAFLTIHIERIRLSHMP